jgi:hypothetical protein
LNRYVPATSGDERETGVKVTVLTLDGVLYDVTGPDVRIDQVVAAVPDRWALLRYLPRTTQWKDFADIRWSRPVIPSGEVPSCSDRNWRLPTRERGVEPTWLPGIDITNCGSTISAPGGDARAERFVSTGRTVSLLGSGSVIDGEIRNSRITSRPGKLAAPFLDIRKRVVVTDIRQSKSSCGKTSD